MTIKKWITQRPLLASALHELHLKQENPEHPFEALGQSKVCFPCWEEGSLRLAPGYSDNLPREALCGLHCFEGAQESLTVVMTCCEAWAPKARCFDALTLGSTDFALSNTISSWTWDNLRDYKEAWEVCANLVEKDVGLARCGMSEQSWTVKKSQADDARCDGQRWGTSTTRTRQASSRAGTWEVSSLLATV